MLKRTVSFFRPLTPTFVLACLLLSGNAAVGGTGSAEPWDKRFFVSTGSELISAAQAVPLPEKDAVVVLLDEGTFSFDAEGRCTSRYRLSYRILTPAGVEDWDTLAAGWAPWYEDRPILRARVVTPDGIEHPLSPETISDSPAGENSPDMFNDRRIVRAPLPALMVGAVVEREIVIREKTPFFAAGSVHTFSFGSIARTLKSRLVLESPAGLPLRHVVRLFPGLVPATSTENGRTRLTFESGVIEPLKPIEAGMPGDFPRRPHVSFTVGRSWAQVAAQYGDVVDSRIGASDISALVREIVGDTTDRDTIVTRLLARLRRDIRYAGTEFGNAALTPYAPEETLKRKYGDCKDQSALLIKMLRTAGIPAYMALLRNGTGEDVEPDLPGMGSFNHAIVFIPGTHPLWIDPTDAFRPVGELPLYDQGRRALIAGGPFTALRVTPEASSAENRQVETREFILSELGKSRVTETSRMWGSIGAFYRRDYGQNDDTAIRKRLDEYARTAYLAERLTRVETSDPKEIGEPFRICIEMQNAERGITDESEAVVAILPAALFERLPSELTGEDEKNAGVYRKHDYLLREPYVYEVHYRIVPPPGFAVSSLPESGTTSMGPMAFSREYRREADGVVTVILRFDTGKRRLTPAEYDAVKKAVRTLRGEEPILVRFEQVGRALLAAGKVRESLAEFRRLSSLHPAEALHHIQTANALLEVGLRDAARREAERAVALEPKSPAAHRTLAYVLQHDAVGRLRHKGFDRNRALAEYRTAKALDPDDFLARGDLAILLEFDEEGQRYSRKADMAAAVEEYRAIRKDLKRNDLDDNLMTCLFRSERWKELKESALSPGSSESRNEYLILAIAGQEGARAAVKEAQRLVPDPATRRKTLETVASSLIIVRRYRDAAELLDEAAGGAANTVSLRARSRLLREVRRFETVSLPEDAPTTVIKKMFLSLFVPESAPEPFFSLFARYIREEAMKEGAGMEVRQVLEVLGAKARSAAGDSPLEVVTDFAVSAVTFHVEGSDAAGYRIDATASPFSEANKFRIFVVKEDGRYRIVPSEPTPQILGMEVLRRIDTGDLAGAKIWLDWAREDLSPGRDDDPLSEEPFLLVWEKGSGAEPERMRIAAACLLSGSQNKQVVPLLLKGRESADESLRKAIDLALGSEYLRGKKYPETLEICDRLGRSYPLSATLFVWREMAFMSMKRWGDMKSLAEERLHKIPKDPAAIRILATCAEQDGDFVQAEKWYKTLLEAGTANAGDYNNLAWLGLFRESVPAESFSFAERAVSLSGGGKGGFLHTLSTLYAETGKTAEAREMILKTISTTDQSVPESTDWYVFGRIAEQYGEVEAAREAYGRVTEPKPESIAAISTYSLARKRLLRLAEGKP